MTPTERRTRGPGAQHERRRREIADAVLDVVAERGLPAVSLTAVAARAGVSPGRVQHYFPAKDRLIEAAFDRGNERSEARIAAKAGPGAGEGGPRRLLTVVLTELIPYDAPTRAHMRVRQWFTGLALADEAIAERMRADYARLHERLAGLLRRDRVPEPGAEAVRLVALAEGLAYYVLIGVTPPADARAQVNAAIAAAYGERPPRGTTGPGS
ncbi:TetR/AcrR family transcriptional regulator [Spirillospora sp. NPDC029432]|uniref:TetR/AcrR family transcriptional regulator n=1 Tax=Spirillospora sp. NPDC029432 TaxID=3154599 RepID=UPI003456FD35